MPVRLLTSSVLKWPDAERVDKSLRRWAEKTVKNRSDVLRIGYLGSYARGDWGVGSDLDLIAVLEEIFEPVEYRAADWDLNGLPVPAEIIVFSRLEWEDLKKKYEVTGYQNIYLFLYYC